MRWFAKLVWVAVVLGMMTGCTQMCFVSECDYEHYHSLMPANLENAPDAGAPQKSEHMSPTTVLDPEKREKWYLSLAEAVAIALENGTTGVQNASQPGLSQDNLMTLGQTTALGNQSDSNRVLALNPARAGARIESKIARFDPKWVTNLNWRFTDQQVQGLGSFNNGQFAHFESGFVKQLATGGVTGITFSSDYTNLAQAPQAFPIQNPAYLSKLSFTFDHPLLQNFGTDINQLLNSHPGAGVGTGLTGFAQSYLNGHNAGLAGGFGDQPGGILLARLRFDQSRAEFERVVNHKLLNVEAAYWNLYGSYINLYASEQGMRMAQRVWEIQLIQAKQGAKSVLDVGRLEGQFRLFQGDRIAAMADVLEKERILRRLLGIPVEDGKQLIPIDAPALAPYQPCWEVAIEETLTLRPELVAARDQLKALQFSLIVEKNFLKPDLRFVSAYEITGLGSRLDGNGQVFDQSTGLFRTNNSLRNLADNNFNNWNMGLVFNVPLGFRHEHAAVRHARLELAQGHMSLRNEEKKAESFLAKTIRDVINNYELIKIRRSQRISFAKQLEQEQVKERGGITKYSESTLQAQRDFVNALNQEFQAIVAYNNSLATFQFAKGTIMQHNSVVISEGHLPECAQVRAVEHERKRSKALLLRERAKPVPHLRCGPNGCGSLPHLSGHAAPSVPALIEGAKIVEHIPAGAANAAPHGGARTELIGDQPVSPYAPSKAPVLPQGFKVGKSTTSFSSPVTGLQPSAGVRQTKTPVQADQPETKLPAIPSKAAVQEKLQTSAPSLPGLPARTEVSNAPSLPAVPNFQNKQTDN